MPRNVPEESDEWGQLGPFISVPCGVQKCVSSKFGCYVEMLRTPFDEALFIQNALMSCLLGDKCLLNNNIQCLIYSILEFFKKIH